MFWKGITKTIATWSHISGLISMVDLWKISVKCGGTVTESSGHSSTCSGKPRANKESTSPLSFTGTCLTASAFSDTRFSSLNNGITLPNILALPITSPSFMVLSWAKGFITLTFTGSFWLKLARLDAMNNLFLSWKPSLDSITTSLGGFATSQYLQR